MTGENFKRINRHDDKVEKMLDDLQLLRTEWSNTSKSTDNINYFNDLNKVTEKIEHLKICIYTYYYNRHLGNYEAVKEFERRYLW